MRRYPNLPRNQRDIQPLVDQFNADEAHWRGLEPRRRLRRKILRRLKKKEHRALDLLEFAKLRPAGDCVGRIMPKAGNSGQGGVGGVLFGARNKKISVSSSARQSRKKHGTQKARKRGGQAVPPDTAAMGPMNVALKGDLP
jgi:hypothetical protein